MSRRIIDLDEPERFVVLTVGEGSQRRICLEAVKDHRSAVVALQDEELALLLERMLMVIDELERRGLAAIDVVTPAREAAVPEGVSSDPILEDFYASVLSIAWDEDVDRFIIEARSHLADEGAGESASGALEDADDEIPDDAPVGPDVMRVHVALPMLQRFVRQATRALGPMPTRCPVCGQPLDPRGHDCAGETAPE